ncbi:MAG: LemA family protein [Bacteroidetes bacterium]|nr:LemA family protein [Bacteroidota bacterium]
METITNTSASLNKQPIKSKTGCLGTTMILMVVFVLLLILSIPACNSYNGMVTRDESYKAKWSEVENLYQRRADLIKNLVETVKGYATHEKTTLTDVTEARAKATSVTIKADKLDANTINQFDQAQGQLTSALGKLMVVVEKYPELKANTGFLELQSQLKITEDTIAARREMFIKVAQDYNTYILRFPKNVFASLFGFKQKAYFNTDKKNNVAPEVKF